MFLIGRKIKNIQRDIAVFISKKNPWTKANNFVDDDGL